eukprot:sb/3466229/
MPPEPFHHFSSPPTLTEFGDYMRDNIPCTFGNWISSDWPALSDWVVDGRPNYELLRDRFGHCKAPVTSFSGTDPVCEEGLVSEFLDYWSALPQDNVVDTFPNSPSPSIPRYLKDWHFTRDSPDSVYTVPSYFADDWLNKYWSQRSDVVDDYKFSYFGPAGSFTPLHADVFRSFSWSVNLCGAKKWLILWPGEEKKLTPVQWCVEEGMERTLDSSSLQEDGSSSTTLRYTIVHQGPGEGIFVPSGWWHQVLNTHHTISINHNWGNLHCAPLMWDYLNTELKEVEREIWDVRELCDDQEWNEQCQLVLRANIGWSFKEFREFVKCNTASRGDDFIHYSLDDVQMFLSSLPT